jgi:hypothetical protein
MEHYIESIIKSNGIKKPELEKKLELVNNELGEFFKSSLLKVEKLQNGLRITDNINLESVLFTVDIIIQIYEGNYLLKYKTNIPTKRALKILQRVKSFLEEENIKSKNSTDVK